MVNQLVSQIKIADLKIDESTVIYHNPSYDTLFSHEMDPNLTGSEKGILTNLGAVTIDTGRFTGRSPKDKYVVKQASSEKNIWWNTDGSDNKPVNEAAWQHMRSLCTTSLSAASKLYVMDGYCGANKETALSVRLITEIAWIAHFFKNLFIRPTDEELKTFQPDWTVLSACKTSCKNYQQYGLNSEVFVTFNFEERMTLTAGTWYGGEIKKGMFSVMNYFLPLQGIGSFHCSANEGEKGDTALFFGLSGTGKTTLSTDPKRKLIGDDEHGWDNAGVFNLEGGCYAKVIDLAQDKEPEIYKALRRDALLENVVVDVAGHIDFTSAEKTENTRASYPIYHIDNIVRPVSKGQHPDKIFFLTCDAYGVLPPVSVLTKEQAMYQYLTGYTAKVAGTEMGIVEPQATFSACFGHPFLTVHPTKYAEILGQKMAKHQSQAYLINTGWSGGSYGVGSRMSLKNTRAILDSIFAGELERAEMETIPIFGFKIPKALPGLDANLLNPRNAWADKAKYDETARKLAQKFIANFQRYAINAEGQNLVQFGPQV